jgi:hypothetical protein
LGVTGQNPLLLKHKKSQNGVCTCTPELSAPEK